jgi:hypothetical protein
VGPSDYAKSYPPFFRPRPRAGCADRDQLATDGPAVRARLLKHLYDFAGRQNRHPVACMLACMDSIKPPLLSGSPRHNCAIIFDTESRMAHDHPTSLMAYQLAEV